MGTSRSAGHSRDTGANPLVPLGNLMHKDHGYPEWQWFEEMQINGDSTSV